MNHILIAAKAWGPMKVEDAQKWGEIEHRIFPCGVCSTDDTQVYHNLLGPHRHGLLSQFRVEHPEAFE